MKTKEELLGARAEAGMLNKTKALCLESGNVGENTVVGMW